MSYPKTLYNGGAYTVVKSLDEELSAKQRGFYDPNESKAATVASNPVINSNINLGGVSTSTSRRQRKRK